MSLAHHPECKACDDGLCLRTECSRCNPEGKPSPHGEYVVCGVAGLAEVQSERYGVDSVGRVIRAIRVKLPSGISEERYEAGCFPCKYSECTCTSLHLHPPTITPIGEHGTGPFKGIMSVRISDSRHNRSEPSKPLLLNGQGIQVEAHGSWLATDRWTVEVTKPGYGAIGPWFQWLVCQASSPVFLCSEPISASGAEIGVLGPGPQGISPSTTGRPEAYPPQSVARCGHYPGPIVIREAAPLRSGERSIGNFLAPADSKRLQELSGVADFSPVQGWIDQRGGIWRYETLPGGLMRFYVKQTNEVIHYNLNAEAWDLPYDPYELQSNAAQWEYRVERFLIDFEDEDLTDKLNRIGAAGWELASSERNLAIFKRPKFIPPS